MKGRGVRIIDERDVPGRHAGRAAKERFVIVDAVGVTESDLVDTVPLDRKPTEPLEKLLKRVSFGIRDPDEISAIAARLSRLDRRLTKEDREELEGLSGGASLKEIASGIVTALDPDSQLAAAREASAGAEPTVEEIEAARAVLLNEAVAPLATNPELRERIVGVRRSYEQAIDETSRDVVIEAGYSKDAADRARSTIESWERFCRGQPRRDHRAADPLRRGRQPQRAHLRGGARARAGDRAAAAELDARLLWDAYERLDSSRVRGSGQRVLTDLVSLVRVALHQSDELVAYPELVRERFSRLAPRAGERGARVHAGAAPLARADPRPRRRGARDHADDFGYTPFVEAGGLGQATQVFGDDLGRCSTSSTTCS